MHTAASRHASQIITRAAGKLRHETRAAHTARAGSWHASGQASILQACRMLNAAKAAWQVEPRRPADKGSAGAGAARPQDAAHSTRVNCTTGSGAAHSITRHARALRRRGRRAEARHPADDGRVSVAALV